MSIRDDIRRVLARPSSQELSEVEVAERVLEMGDEYDWRDAALELLPEAVWAIRRQEVRRLEREARERYKARQSEQEAKARAEGFATWDDWQAHLAAQKEDERRLNIAQSNGYPSWDAMKEANAQDARADKFLADLRFQQDLHRIMKPFFAAMEFTEAFLNSKFAIGNGRRVCWGDATRDDHVARIKFMQSRIEGIAEDIALHERVLSVLSDLNVETLRQARALEPTSR